MTDNNKMNDETKQLLLDTGKKRHNEYVNDKKKQDNLCECMFVRK